MPNQPINHWYRELQRRRRERLRKELQKPKRPSCFRKDQQFRWIKVKKEALLRFMRGDRRRYWLWYDVTALYVKHKGYNKEAEWGDTKLNNAFYFDANYNFILWYKNKPLAVISFEIVNNKVILVKQIQSAKGNYGYLTNFRWEQFLLQVVVDWALKRENFKEVRVMRAEEISWYKNRTDQVKETMKMRYNITSKKLGFKLSHNGKYWFFKRKFLNRPQ